MRFWYSVHNSFISTIRMRPENSFEGHFVFLLVTVLFFFTTQKYLKQGHLATEGKRLQELSKKCKVKKKKSV